MTTDPQMKAGMADALARLWAKFLPEIEARVAVLEAAAAAASSLPLEQREAAHAAAHKLAGSLGTFGLARGTELARQVELALAPGAVAMDATTVQHWVTELRALLDARCG